VTSSDRNGFTSIGQELGHVLKEIVRRSELRQRLEAELGRTISDEEFIEVAEQTGLKI
jgi:EAL domain-containing protein (putative c-di-GMP-specific phosphodiesterase class I)